MRRRALSVLPALAALAALAACDARWPGTHERGFPSVGVYEHRLTLGEKDDGAAVTAVDRASRAVAVYRVTLNGVPLGARLPLECAWVDPGGRVAHRNAWRTAKTTKDVWPTHCRFSFGPSSAAGAWKVEMSLDGRLVRSTPFEVR